MNFQLEVCADSVESALAAERGGADRIELCSNLIIGGTTPSLELFRLVKDALTIPVHVLIRPRFGDFLYSSYEIEEMRSSIRHFLELGADGIVIGMLRPDGSLDTEGMKYLLGNVPANQNSIGGRVFHLTLHRAFDMTRDPYEAYETARKLGFDYILTSGQKNCSLDGTECLKKLCELSTTSFDASQAPDSISGAKTPEIMAGGGIRGPEDVKALYEAGIRNFHMSGKSTYESQMVYRNPDVSMGLSVASEYCLWKTDEEKIRKISALRSQDF